MAYKTFTQLMGDVVSAIGEVSGTSVQTYAEPRVRVALNQIFELVFRKVWWPQYMQMYQLTLDGTLGVVTTNELFAVKEFRDFRSITIAGQNRPLTILPQNFNPYTLTGTKPVYFSSLNVTDTNYLNRKLQIWPKTATGDLVINARLFPTISEATTILYIDDNILVNGAAWMILEDEDINLNAAQNRKELFDEFFSAAVKALADHPMENPYGAVPNSDYVSEWQAP